MRPLSSSLLYFPALVFLLVAPTIVSGACVSWLTSTALTGSTSASSTLDFFLLGTHKPAGEDCTWEITCPSGTHIGYKNYKFMTGSGVNIKFFDVTTDPANTSPVANYHSGLSQFTTYTTHDGRRALFPGVEKLKIQYTTTGSSSGWGFKLDYRCYTDLCPSDIVSVAPTAVTTSTASYWENYGDFTPGTTCLWSSFFSCATPTDTPIVSFTQSSYKDGVIYKLIADDVGEETSIDLDSFYFARVKTTHISASYSLQLSVPANPIYFDSGAGPAYLNTRDNLATWGTCQPASASTCYAPTRAGTLTDSGVFISDPSGTSNSIRTFDSQTCSYTVSCTPGSSTITFIGKTSSTSPASHNQLQIRDPNDSNTIFHEFTTSETTYTFSGTSVELYWRRALSGSSYGFSGAEVSYQCDAAPSATPAPLTTLPSTPAPPTTPVPETPVPETPVPETPVPETPVPETPVPETPVPETPVPETPVPETPVPETPVPETPVPETSVPETPVPTSVSETPQSTVVIKTTTPNPTTKLPGTTTLITPTSTNAILPPAPPTYGPSSTTAPAQETIAPTTATTTRLFAAPSSPSSQDDSSEETLVFSELSSGATSPLKFPTGAQMKLLIAVLVTIIAMSY